MFLCCTRTLLYITLITVPIRFSPVDDVKNTDEDNDEADDKFFNAFDRSMAIELIAGRRSSSKF